ncbi:MAG: bifunctional diaminohydroxyphosphoribosylaminopyrimidine deaminase/5-amino-6-(5-phosphoribosylamino)uracil reductase RibD [Verrucomicrobia subdivision 3 bacterium]|nr:bifunctional diaminohydroxyphosphoribosylaminopyrimidine deaminase/5-amino-6-(5-phosphoribosylamino)uracil reductase RibD [Limisphaerales bacterium]
MREALALARKGYALTSPNPMVGAILVKGSVVIGKGWHRRAGGPHAEIAALNNARKHDYNVKGSTLYVTLEPCSTTGKTPPCTEAIIEAGIARVVVAAKDPNPAHSGRAFRVLRRAGIEVVKNILADEATELNAAFNHWIVKGTPLVTVKAAMTLDGKIATEHGESKWITSEAARREAMHLRKGADAILVGIETVLADDPSLTVRGAKNSLRRIILDSKARTPVTANVVADEHAALTTVVVAKGAPARRVEALRKRVDVIEAPARKGRVDLRWLLKRLGREEVTQLLVEGGGEVNASFIENKLAQRVAFFYAPKVLGGKHARPAVGGKGAANLKQAPKLTNVQWRRLGPDLLLTARVVSD